MLPINARAAQALLIRDEFIIAPAQCGERADCTGFSVAITSLARA
jgi:hypothetical protein